MSSIQGDIELDCRIDIDDETPIASGLLVILYEFWLFGVMVMENAMDDFDDELLNSRTRKQQILVEAETSTQQAEYL